MYSITKQSDAIPAESTRSIPRRDPEPFLDVNHRVPRPELHLSERRRDVALLRRRPEDVGRRDHRHVALGEAAFELGDDRGHAGAGQVGPACDPSART